MRRRIFHNKNRKNYVEPDEVFMDSHNEEKFDLQQFEGRIEKAIPKRTILFLGIFFVLCVTVVSFRLGYLQIEKGEAFLKRSEDNTLERIILFADRGIIYDRNKVELAWNEKLAQEEDYALRKYLSPGFAHVLGYIDYPTKDKSGRYWQSEFVGQDGLEKQYDYNVRGENGSKIIETDARRQIHSENTTNNPKPGKDLVTTLDGRIQKELYQKIKALSEQNAFTGGAGVIMDIRSGELIASVSYPEYDSEVLSAGKETEKIKSYMSDKRKVFLDRVISGLYTPGSIVKPIFALGALSEGVIDPYKQILSTGSISVPNPYFPDQPTIFKDWKAHGWVDMREAIAVSSDVYFYEIGGGFQGQKGIGIQNLEKYARLFGISQKTNVDLPDETSGTIPNPQWKAKNFAGDPWRVGDTYNTAIGQYGFQVTPMEMIRAVAAIANNGMLVTPHFILGDKEKEREQARIDLEKEYFDVVREGMRGTVEYGTATVLNVPYVKAAAKTGTAQLGAEKNRVNSWVVGFFPYENPKYAFTVLMESGPADGTVGATVALRHLFDWMSTNAPEYFQ